MIDNDIKRITRLTAILTQLQTKRLIKAQELAAELLSTVGLFSTRHGSMQWQLGVLFC